MQFKSTTCQSHPAPALAMRTVTYCTEIKGTPYGADRCEDETRLSAKDGPPRRKSPIEGACSKPDRDGYEVLGGAAPTDWPSRSPSFGRADGEQRRDRQEAKSTVRG